MTDQMTPGPWEWNTTPYVEPKMWDIDLPILLGSNGEEVCNFGRGTEYYPIEGKAPKAADARLMAAAPRLQEALTNLLRYAECNTCQHECTHRGGVIWTICDSCGKKWADDEGGFQPYVDPPEITAAREALDNSKGES